MQRLFSDFSTHSTFNSWRSALIASAPLLICYWYGFINSCSSQWLLVNFCPQLFWCSNCLRFRPTEVSPDQLLCPFGMSSYSLSTPFQLKTRTYVSVQFSRSVVSDSLQLRGLQRPSLPCPSPAPELAQTQVHRVSDAIQPSHSLSSPFPPAFNLSQHQGLFQ